MDCTQKIETDLGTLDDSVLRGLVYEIANKCQPSLSQFYEATINRVYSTALRIARKPELAEEVVADVYMQVWRDAALYDPARGMVLGWVLIIARTRVLDLLRKQDKAFSSADPLELIDESQLSVEGADDLLSALHAKANLHAALHVLSSVQRQLLALAFFRGMTHAEIVEHCGMPLGSVKSQIRRALLILRQHLIYSDLRPTGCIG
jgi:RNA polymerase sigma factor (sigma-70 family)